MTERSDLTLNFPSELVEAMADRMVELLDERGLLAARGPEPWIDVDAAAAYVGKKRDRLYDLAAQGAIAHGRDGRSVLFRRSDLDAYLTAHRNGGTP
jgi:excisionase family DNA binding protein